ncbi:hypothetical protein [Paenibacillus eucommiae]|uniref:Uncharacterized protein n=1 Tax=Paenibacillus eucommiae TaxID=1355755 RepID=A0ABS4IXE6_9BACL|nr:hypothetical protein [Paenibacillus eucommiae]MBP1992220.1 hypothetical protein [Paenibacillus eucommiae]
MGDLHLGNPNRVNIINFIRGVEPRLPMDLLEALRAELALVRKHGLRATWLIQYDALIDPEYTGLLKREADSLQELGAWFEVVQPMAEKAGIPWRGRYAWDWHSHVGFSIGYTPIERERLADVFMEAFHAEFGSYPKSVGSWFIDAHLLAYLADRYGIIASCNCKDQWGTDGYTLWGGYYNQAYYPSRFNGFMPAQTEANQINVPVFRMLGSDPIYQYDAADHGYGQSVVTLEPVYAGAEGGGGGGNPEWVRWFFDTNFRPSQVSFGYAQVGQENSFGWERIKDGLTDQIELLAKKQAEGALVVETLAETGQWFKEQYPLTPASAICALDDWKDEDRQSVWYYNRNYRINLFREKEHFRIRDIHVFDETYEERYLRDVCETEDCCYDTLPVVDGARWNDLHTQTGIVPVVFDPVGNVVPIIVLSMRTDDTVPGELLIVLDVEGGESIALHCTDTSVSIRSELDNWGLCMAWGDAPNQPDFQPAEASIHYTFNGHSYAVRIEGSSELKIERTQTNFIQLRPLYRELKLIMEKVI